MWRVQFGSSSCIQKNCQWANFWSKLAFNSKLIISFKSFIFSSKFPLRSLTFNTYTFWCRTELRLFLIIEKQEVRQRAVPKLRPISNHISCPSLVHYISTFAAHICDISLNVLYVLYVLICPYAQCPWAFAISIRNKTHANAKKLHPKIETNANVSFLICSVISKLSHRSD